MDPVSAEISSLDASEVLSPLISTGLSKAEVVSPALPDQTSSLSNIIEDVDTNLVDQVVSVEEAVRSSPIHPELVNSAAVLEIRPFDDGAVRLAVIELSEITKNQGLVRSFYELSLTDAEAMGSALLEQFIYGTEAVTLTDSNIRPQEMLRFASPELQGLPAELLHSITMCLGPSDAISLSQTCFWIWKALNDDGLWKRYLVDNDDSLDTLDQQVEPALQLKGFELSCPNRKRVMKQELILNNWRNGTYLSHTEKTTHSYQSEALNKLKVYGQDFYKDKYLFVGRYDNDTHSDGIDVWDLRNKVPVLLTTFNNENRYFDGFYVIGEYLVVTECIKVYVYRINLSDKEFLLEYSFIVSEESVCYNERVEHAGRCDRRCVNLCYLSVGNYLLMNKFGEPTNALQVWDIPNARKEGCFQSPIRGISIIFQAKLDNYWVMFQNMRSNPDIFYVFLDLEKKEFSSYVCKCSTSNLCCIFFNRFAIVFKNALPCNADGFNDTECCVYPTNVTSSSDKRSISIHELDTAPELAKRKFKTGKTEWIPATKIVKGKFIIKCTDYIHIVKAASLESISKFPCNSSLIFTHHIDVMNSLFVLSCDPNTVPFEVDLLDVANQTVVGKFKTGFEYVYLNRSCSKLVMISYSSITVVSF